jgi:two-component system, NarL family, nitrate/nitrite response regulator NarL
LRRGVRRAKAIEEAERLTPDVVVLNVTMPVLGGFDAARVIKKKMPKSAIVILSTHADKVFIEEVKEAGANAYVVKSKADEALVMAIERAIAGKTDFLLVQ